MSGGREPFSVEQARERFSYDPETGAICHRTIPGSANNIAWFNRAYAGKEISYRNSDGYIKLKALGQSVSAHRLAYALYYGKWPNGQIDHINGDKADNRITNLRVVTISDNNKNKAKQRNNTSGHVGVYYVPALNAWRARIKANGVYYDLGTHKDMADAISARKSAELDLGFHANHGREKRA
jgi:hypothetical protein